jgi:excisionase family DNA binding protein
MTIQKQGSSPIVRYITVQDAVERLGVVERTVRRWIEKKKLHAIHDASGFVRLDLDAVERIAQERHTVVPSSRQQVEMLLERVERLESENEAQEQKYDHLQRLIEGVFRVLAGEPITDEHGQPLSLSDSHLAYLRPVGRNKQEPLERRGLPAGTMRLVNFAQLHQVKLSDLKRLHMLHELNLTIYQRDAGAIRNKQEWWISPEQHQQVATYCQQHSIPYMPCSQCDSKEI